MLVINSRKTVYVSARRKNREVNMVKRKPIYVEIQIQADIENVWDASQKPDMHEQWDLRFSSITYLPKEEGKPQEFVYSRTVGPFINVRGWGKSVGSFHNEDGTRSSSLKFETEKWISPIRHSICH